MNAQPQEVIASTAAAVLQRARHAWQQGELTQAQALCQTILYSQPEHADACSLLGIILFQSGNSDAGIDLMRRATIARPQAAELHNNLAYALQQLERLDAAIIFFEQAVAVDPAFDLAWHNLGDCHARLGRPEQAMRCYQRAIAVNSERAVSYNNLGNVYRELGQDTEALACYQRALELQKNFELPLNNMGLLLASQGDANRAIACFRQALSGKPGAAQSDAVLYNLANLLVDCHAFDEALPLYLQALANNCQHLGALANVVSLKQTQCDWGPLTDGLIQKLMAQYAQSAEFPVSPFRFLSLPASTPAQQLECATIFSRHYQVHQPYLHAAPLTAPGRLRIGYVSADYQTHATTSLIAQLFELHERADFEIVAYSIGQDDAGDMRRHMAQSADRFIDLRLDSDRHAAERIRGDDIHILVDLKGHTAEARPRIFHHCPAPVQVNWLGYPGTMGAACFDYILTDQFITPVGHEAYFSEKIVRLPGCYQLNDRGRRVARAPTRAECGIPEQAFVLASFNQSYKITPAMFDVWMRLLCALPNAVLWLLAASELAMDNLRREANRRGVDPQRLIFAAIAPREQHLARYHLADLCLDTFPVTSHTTGSDALWVGCPLVTCAGDSFVSRVAGSLLSNVGLGELITWSFEAYTELALQLAREPHRLHAMRQHLIENRDQFPLFDSARFVCNLEDAYRVMWQTWQMAQPGQVSTF